MKRESMNRLLILSSRGKIKPSTPVVQRTEPQHNPEAARAWPRIRSAMVPGLEETTRSEAGKEFDHKGSDFGIKTGDNSWRLFNSDHHVGFRVYRSVSTGRPIAVVVMRLQTVKPLLALAFLDNNLTTTYLGFYCRLAWLIFRVSALLLPTISLLRDPCCRSNDPNGTRSIYFPTPACKAMVLGAAVCALAHPSCLPMSGRISGYICQGERGARCREVVTCLGI